MSIQYWSLVIHQFHEYVYIVTNNKCICIIIKSKNYWKKIDHHLLSRFVFYCPSDLCNYYYSKSKFETINHKFIERTVYRLIHAITKKNQDQESCSIVSKRTFFFLSVDECWLYPRVIDITYNKINNQKFSILISLCETSQCNKCYNCEVN